MQVNDREGSGKPRATLVQIFELAFSKKNCAFLNQLDLRIPKNAIFISVWGLEMSKFQPEKGRYQQIRFSFFWAICLPNIDIST